MKTYVYIYIFIYICKAQFRDTSIGNIGKDLQVRPRCHQSDLYIYMDAFPTSMSFRAASYFLRMTLSLAPSAWLSSHLSCAQTEKYAL